MANGSVNTKNNEYRPGDGKVTPLWLLLLLFLLFFSSTMTLGSISTISQLFLT